MLPRAAALAILLLLCGASAARADVLPSSERPRWGPPFPSASTDPPPAPAPSPAPPDRPPGTSAGGSCSRADASFAALLLAAGAAALGAAARAPRRPREVTS